MTPRAPAKARLATAATTGARWAATLNARAEAGVARVAALRARAEARARLDMLDEEEERCPSVGHEMAT